MQIWKSVNVLYVEYFTLKYPLLFEISAREISERFVYKRSETIEHVKNQPTFSEIYKHYGQITW